MRLDLIVVVLTVSILLLLLKLVLPGFHNCDGCFQVLFNWQPPIVLARVALSLWPGFFAVQVALLWSHVTL